MTIYRGQPNVTIDYIDILHLIVSVHQAFSCFPAFTDALLFFSPFPSINISQANCYTNFEVLNMIILCMLFIWTSVQSIFWVLIYFYWLSPRKYCNFASCENIRTLPLVKTEARLVYSDYAENRTRLTEFFQTSIDLCRGSSNL